MEIPVFTSQLEKARESTDAANLRAAYAELEAGLLTTETTPTAITVKVQQTKPDWESEPDWPDNLSVDKVTADKKTSWSVAVDADGNVTATIS